MNWAFAQPVSKSSAKFVLVAMANLVGADGVCWPSGKHLVEATGQDIKTVEAGLKRLREAGYITDTGERRGVTGQVIVYRLNTPEFGGLKPLPNTPVFPENTPKKGAVSVAENTPVFPSNTTEIGGVEEIGNTPVFPHNTPVFPDKDPQISQETPPKTGDGTTNEPPMNPKEPKKRKGSFDASLITIPDWLNSEVWVSWCNDRKTRGKPITEVAAGLQIAKLAEMRAKGHDPESVIKTSIENGWSGLFEPKNRQPAFAPRATSRHSGFQQLDYTTGVNDDGSFH